MQDYNEHGVAADKNLEEGGKSMKIRMVLISLALMLVVGVASVAAETKEGVELGKTMEVTITQVMENAQIGKNGVAIIGNGVEVYVPDAKKGEKYKITVKNVVKNASTGKLEAQYDRVYEVKEGVELGKVIEVTITSEYLNTFTKRKSGLVVIGKDVEVYITNAKVGEKYKIIVKAVEVSTFSGKFEADFVVVK